MSDPDSTDMVHRDACGADATGGAERQAEDPSRSAIVASAADSPFTEAEPGSFDKRNPRNLLNLFSVLSVLSVVAILLLAGYGM